MTYYSKRSIVSIVTTVIIFVSFYPNALINVSDLDKMSQEIPIIWAQFFAILLIANVVIKLIVMVLFKIGYSVLSKEKEPVITDERDQLIELKAVRNLFFTFMIGFFLSMITLVFKQPISTMFQILAYFFLLSGITLEVSYIYYYEREA